MKYASFGSVSHGTMRDWDLVSAFSSELDYQMKRQPKRFPRRALRKLVSEARRTLAKTEDAALSADDLVHDLFEALEQFAPPYAYFGAHEGDGSDYGYWLSSEITEDFDGLKVDDTSEVPAGYRGEVLHVNDHGNLTLYVAGSRGLKEIWGIV